METEDDMIVLVVVDDDQEKSVSVSTVPLVIKTEPECSMEDSVSVKEEPANIFVKDEPLDDYELDYLDDELLQNVLKEEVNHDYKEEFANNNCDTQQESDKHRFSMLKPWQQRSFVAELRQEYPELQEDEELLINTLEQIMRSAKPPPPPKDYYVMTGIMFECVKCGAQTESIPAASRHYQEKHGQRYLVCYACGVDFRSPSNLYKHEKRCVAPDASIVLKARAACLGRKGRSRPYLKLNAAASKNEKNRFSCTLCSAVFMTRRNLQSHENLHRGERPYQCHVCPCAYTSYSALSRHSMKHTDIQFVCDHCNRSFKIKAALVSHMDTHKPQRKHGCTACNRRFAQKSALKLHFNKVHQNLPPPCACQICPKRYPRMSLLKSHMKREHGMSIITRKMFFKSLPTMTDLEIKESKVVMKSQEIDIEDNTPLDADEMFRQSFEQNKYYIEENSNNSVNGENNSSLKVFMQCVKQSDISVGSNVLYVENGEFVKSEIVDNERETLVLQLEAMVHDGDVLFDPLAIKDEISVRTTVRSEDVL